MPPKNTRSSALFLFALLVFIAGCSHKRKIAYVPPPPPTLTTRTSGNQSDVEFVETHRPIYSEKGLASWYGPPYHNRRGANGKIYNEHAMSAANRTLPMNSLVRVTNLKTGQSAVMRITDRGPFVPHRIIDLSLASAKAVGVWRPGIAEVRVDVYAAPKSIFDGGRWCVQIGAFRHQGEAKRLQSHLEHKYRTANTIEFKGPTGYWVRIRPAKDDKSQAVLIAKELRPSEGEAYLVRLD